jgi:hypothetical protein
VYANAEPRIRTTLIACRACDRTQHRQAYDALRAKIRVVRKPASNKDLLRVNERVRDARDECATARVVVEIPCNQRDFAKMQHVNNFSLPERDSAVQNASLGKK